MRLEEDKLQDLSRNLDSLNQSIFNFLCNLFWNLYYKYSKFHILFLLLHYFYYGYIDYIVFQMDTNP